MRRIYVDGLVPSKVFRLERPYLISFPAFIRYFLLLLLSISLNTINAQDLKARLKIELALKERKPDTTRIRLLQDLGSYYLYKPGEYKNDLDSAFYQFGLALNLSRELHFKKGELTTMLLMGNAYLEGRDFPLAKTYYVSVANYYHEKGDKLKEALAWKSFAEHIEYHDMPHLADRERAFKFSYELLKQIPGKQTDALNAYKDIADVHLNQEKYQLAEADLLLIASQFEKMHYVKIYQTYFLLGEVYKRTQNFEKLLFYRIACVKSADADSAAEPNEKALYYFELAQAYLTLKDFGQCIAWGKKSLELSKKVNFNGYYAILALVTTSLSAEKRTAEALSFLKKQETVHPPQSDYDKGLVNRLHLQYNTALRHYGEAAKAIPFLINTYTENQIQQAKRDSNFVFIEDYVRTLACVADYYLKTDQYKRAEQLLIKLWAVRQEKIRAGTKMSIYSLAYKIDSLNGNYLASLRNYAKMASINDSISNYAKNEQIARMYAGFKTFQKEQAIQLLNKKNDDQEIHLQKAGLRQKYLVGIGLLLMLVTCLAFYALRNKQRGNKMLRAQQLEINIQNEQLSVLVGEKDHLLEKQDKLITEKDWLLKEVHHRVKNNLQIVMSLLSSQSAYLESNAAIEAIRESQNRVQAISLIHQKLYSSPNVASIIMPAYVRDLVSYLADCFDARNRGIKIEQIVEPFNLDLAQAVPLGLILNEAITNAIKYAFDELGGVVIIAIHQVGNDGLILNISDNGKGLPKDFDLKNPRTLGMEMMKALSKQLGGEFKVSNKAGLHISVEFVIEREFSQHLEINV